MEQIKQLSAIQARAVMQLIDIALVQRHVLQSPIEAKVPDAKIKRRRDLRRVNQAFRNAVVAVVRSGVGDLTQFCTSLGMAASEVGK
jgi:hypothetical protein